MGHFGADQKDLLMLELDVFGWMGMGMKVGFFLGHELRSNKWGFPESWGYPMCHHGTPLAGWFVMDRTLMILRYPLSRKPPYLTISARVDDWVDD